MPKPRNKIKIGAYVQLQEGFDETDLYRNVEAGATGWVKKSKVDDGFPMIFIEWDEKNPKYAGEVNKWVFESHFKPLADKETLMEDYIASVSKATDGALIAEAFVMIAVTRTINPITGDEIFKPIIVSNDLNNDAAFVLEAQIVYAASNLFNTYIQETIDSLKEEEDDESGR